MGKQRNYRFPQGINGTDRFYYPHRHANQGNFPNIIFNGNTANGSRYFDISEGFEYGSDMFSNTDVWGSYTGIPTDETDRPIQDADDL